VPKSTAPAPKPTRPPAAASSTPVDTPQTKRGGWVAPLLAATAVAVVVSLNSLWNGYVTDDNILIRQNRDLDSWSTIGRGFTHYLMLPWVYRPIIFLSYFLDKQLWGADPFGFHLTNLVSHALVTGLVFVWGFMLLRERRVAFAAALLFAVMPVHSESVAWISGRTDVLSALFFLAALVLATHSLQGVRPRWGAYAGSLVLFAVAMLTKEMSATLPVVLGLQMLCFGQPTWARRLRSRAWLLAPYFAIIAIYFAVRTAAIGGAMIGQAFPNANIMTTFKASPLIILWYLWLLIQPAAGRLYYQIDETSSANPFPALVLIALLAGLVYATVRRRREAFWGWWFLATLFPILLIPTDPRMADHYIYLPTVGFALAVGLGAVRLLDWCRQGMSPAVRLLLPGVMVLVLLVMAWDSCRRNAYWKDSIVFYTAMTRQDPTIAVAHSNLGTLLFAENRPEEGLVHLQQAVKLKPNFPEVLDNLAGAYYKLGRYDEAVKIYQRVLAKHPRDGRAALFLAKSLLAAGRPHEALLAITRFGVAYNGTPALAQNLAAVEEALQASLATNPRDPQALADLGIARDLQGRPAEAVKAWQRALALNPQQVELYLLIARGHERAGNLPAARAAYQAFLQAAPGSEIAQRVRTRLQALSGEPRGAGP